MDRTRQLTLCAIALLAAVSCGRGPDSATSQLFVVPLPLATPPPGALKIPRTQRPFYPYSVVYGGVHSRQELAEAADNDSVVGDHYRDILRDRVQLVKLSRDTQAYVSYRTSDGIFWTRTPVTLRANEELLSDGDNLVRARCGNRISQVPRTPMLPEASVRSTPAAAADAAEPEIASFESPFPAETSAPKPDELFEQASVAPSVNNPLSTMPAIMPLPGPKGADGNTIVNSGGAGFMAVGGAGGGGGGSAGGGGGAGSGSASSSLSSSSTTPGSTTIVYSSVGFVGYTALFMPVLNSSILTGGNTTNTTSSSSFNSSSTTTNNTYNYTSTTTTATTTIAPPPGPIVISWNPPNIPYTPVLVCCSSCTPQETPPKTPPIDIPFPPGSPEPPGTPHHPSTPPGDVGPPPSSVPEPSAMFLLGVGLVFLGWLGRRRPAA